MSAIAKSDTGTAANGHGIIGLSHQSKSLCLEVLSDFLDCLCFITSLLVSPPEALSPLLTFTPAMRPAFPLQIKKLILLQDTASQITINKPLE